MVGRERESDLVSRAVAGDPVALKTLLTVVHAPLCRYISLRIPLDLGRVIDAEDIVQEAHIEVFRRIHQFEVRGPGSFFRWVAVIALNRLRNALSRHRTAKRGGGRAGLDRARRSIEDSSVVFLDTLAGKGHTPSRSVARGEAVQAVETAMADLPEPYREALRLVHIEGRSVAYAAEQMGRTERSIQGLCRRGLKLMQQCMAGASNYFSSTG